MTRDEHIEAHKQLHHSLDLLVADFIQHNQGMPSRSTIMDLIRWSHAQMENPTLPPGTHYDEIKAT